MASTLPVIPVWIGATLALFITSAGRSKTLEEVSLHRLHQISGVFILILTTFALTKFIDHAHDGSLMIILTER